MKKKHIIFILFVVFFSSNLIAETEFFNAGSMEFYSNEEAGDLVITKVNGKDYFASGETVSLKGVIDDAYILGEKVYFEGKSTGGINAIAETVALNGIISKNVHSIAKSIKINGSLKDTVFLAAQDIVIGKEAIIDGTLFAGGSVVHIFGTLKNGLVAGAGEVIIDGPITGDVNLKVGKLRITQRGSIKGNLTYAAKSKLSSDELGRISGNVTFNVDDEIDENEMKKFFMIFSVISLVSLIVAGLLILLLPAVKNIYNKETNSRCIWKTLLWGLIPIFIYPMLVLFTIPLLPLSVALILGVFPLIGLALALGLTLAGDFLFDKFNWKKQSLALRFLFALLIFALLQLIPFIGQIVTLGIMAMGSGLILSKLFRTEFK